MTDEKNAAHSTPWDAPLVPSLPFSYRNAEILTLTYRTDPAAIARLLPAPLEPVSDVVVVHIYDMRDVDWFGPYHECNVMVGARLPDGATGGYSPYLFLDSDGGLAFGRELHGQPKKFANPRLEFRQDLVVGVVERNGIEIITGTMAYKQKRGEIAELKSAFDFTVNLNLKVIPHVDGTAAIRQVTSRTLADVTVHECWVGDCTVELRPNIQAPVYRLPVLESLTGCHWRADFTLVGGSVAYDFPEHS